MLTLVNAECAVAMRSYQGCKMVLLWLVSLWHGNVQLYVTLVTLCGPLSYNTNHPVVPSKA